MLVQKGWTCVGKFNQNDVTLYFKNVFEQKVHAINKCEKIDIIVKLYKTMLCKSEVYSFSDSAQTWICCLYIKW